jgi:hypothetical protein
MQSVILWEGIEYFSLEHCLINQSGNGVDVHSAIVGEYNHVIYRIDYFIQTDRDWNTVSFSINSRLNDTVRQIQFTGDTNGNWISAIGSEGSFAGCVDVDIPVTPFTNTLPIRRLKLAPGQSQEIKVVYLDMLEQSIRPVTQKYTRVSAREYRYENVPNDFEAKITVDDEDFVVDYPGLFARKSAFRR